MVKKATKTPAPKITKRKKKGDKVQVTTPIGTFSYPNLLEPDSGRQYSDDKYKTDLLFKEKDFKTDPAAKALREAILKVGRRGTKDPNATLSDFKHPLRRTSEMGEKYSENERTKNCIVIRAKTEYDPIVIDAQKNEMDAEAVKKIKGGDEGRLIVSVFWYDQQGGGVALGLTIVQWLKSGEALGGGRQALIDELDEIEIEDIEDVETDDDEEEAPKPKRKKKVVEEDDEEENEDDDSDDEDESEDADEDDEDDDSSDEEDESEEDDDSDDADDEEEEEEKPKGKKVAAKSKSKSKPAKPAPKGKKKASKKDEEEDDDFSFDD